MAYATVRASSQSFTVGSAPATAVPVTIACLCLTDDDVNNQNLVNLLTNSGTVSGFALAARGDESDVIKVSSFGTAAFPATSAAYATNVWNYAAGVFVNSSSRFAYLNLTGTQNANTEAAGTPNRLEIAGFRGGNTLSGKIAEVAVWNADLTNAEINSLAKGFKPTRVRPQSLVFYAPLIRDLQDTKGGLAITNNNSATVAEHPRVY